MILCLNTSLADLHIGLFSDTAELLAEFHQQATPDDRHIHDALLAAKTSELLESLSASAKDISTVALIIGPGSFTGLRIGLSFAKGLAFGSGAKIIPLKAHEVLLKSYQKKYSPSYDPAIVYPSYEAHKTYMAPYHSPEDILDTTVDEVKRMGIKNIICPPELEWMDFTKTVIPIELKIMAEMACQKQDSITGQSLSNLEPFYGTDFTVKV